MSTMTPPALDALAVAGLAAVSVAETPCPAAIAIPATNSAVAMARTVRSRSRSLLAIRENALRTFGNAFMK